MKRRKFIQLAGGGVVLAAAGVAGFASTRTPAKALEPWAKAGGSEYTDPRLYALSYAILSPNPHNRQPWNVELVGKDGLVLRFDTAKQLPHTDPFDRQLTIGLGCFLELMNMAANSAGFKVDLELFPAGMDSQQLDDRPIAFAKFSQSDDVSSDPLWNYVMDRRSNKEPYDTARTVSATSLKEIVTVGANGTRIGGSVQAGEIDFWRTMTEEALKIEIETPRTYKESVDLFRIGKHEVNRNPDGIDFWGPMFEFLAMTGLFSRQAALATGTTTYQQGVEAVLDNCRTAMGHIWMVTKGNSRKDQIAAGADWLRINLAATRAGLGFQPLSQALQEYPEMEKHKKQVHTLLAPDGGTVQLLARIGYGPRIPFSPRWPIEAKVGGA